MRADLGLTDSGLDVAVQGAVGLLHLIAFHRRRGQARPVLVPPPGLPGLARQHLWRMVVARGVPQHAAQRAGRIADRDDHPSAITAASQLKQSRARPHACLLCPAAHPAATPVQPERWRAAASSSSLIASSHDVGAPGSVVIGPIVAGRCARGRERVPRPRQRASADERGGWSDRARSSRRSPPAARGRARALRHTLRPRRRTPSSATHTPRRAPSRTGRGRRAHARPGPQSTPPAPPG